MGDLVEEAIGELVIAELPHLRGVHGTVERGIAAGRDEWTVASNASLPYDRLNEQDFERLCFHLLLSKNRKPRFWGRRGVRQRGIDLIVSDGDVFTVYQCKRYATVDAKDLKSALKVFYQDWLTGCPELGRPQAFVFCTSAVVRHTDEWQRVKRVFARRYRVAVDEWHREGLDAWLKHEPGIVADLFGDRVAEIFCGCGRDWDLGLFQPVVRGTDTARIDRFLALRDSARLVRDADVAADFDRVLRENGQGAVLLGGLAGTGKTMTALDLATAFADGTWRVFYLRPSETDSVDGLFDGIRHRAFRPTIFVLDDCHLSFGRVEQLYDRVCSLGDTRVKLVLTARLAPAGADAIHLAGARFVERLREAGQVIRIVAGEAHYRAIVRTRLPGRDLPVDQLMDWSGRDLAILDIVLDTVTSTDQIDVARIEDLFQRMLASYFEGARTVYAPNLRQLAALAQFDVSVPRDLFPDPLETAERNSGAIHRLVTVSGRPAALAFHHPSAAELIFRLLCWGDAEDRDRAGARDLTELLLRAEQQRGGDYALNTLLHGLLQSRLRLADDEPMKQALLQGQRLAALIARHGSIVGIPLLAGAVIACRRLAEPPPYAALLTRRTEALISNPSDTDKAGLLAAALNALRLTDTAAHHALEHRLGPAQVAKFIGERGSLRNLLRLFPACTESFAVEVLRAFNGVMLEALIDRIGSKGSIATLSVHLRDLGKLHLSDEPGRTRLHLFEDRFGVARMVQLIRERGSLIDLLRLLVVSTGNFAAELLYAFDGADMAKIVARVGVDTSLGTISLHLRELAERSLSRAPDRTQLHLFEERLGAAPMAGLIRRSGTLPLLLQVLAYSTTAYFEKLLQAFDRTALEELVARVGCDTSIGTMNMALATLKRQPMSEASGRTRLHLFEERLGIAPMAELIRRRGTLAILLRVLVDSTAGYATKLLQAFDGAALDDFIARIGPGENIGVIHRSLRSLARQRIPETQAQTLLHAFENLLGADRMAKLIRERGSLRQFLRILEVCSARFAGQLLQAFDDDALETLIARVGPAMSIGTLNLSLDKMSKRPAPGSVTRTQLHQFEERLGVRGFWRMVMRAGNFNHLAYILPSLSEGFRTAVLDIAAVPTQDEWAAFALARTYYDPARFVRDNLHLLPTETAERIRLALESTAATLVERSTLGDVGTGLTALASVANVPLRNVLVEPARKRIEAATIDAAQAKGYEDAVSAIAALWNHRVDLRPELGAALWQLLPQERTWPQTEALIPPAINLLEIARSPHVNHADAIRVLRAFAPLASGKPVTPEGARHLARFLWGLHALRYERGPELAGDFRSLQHDATWRLIAKAVERRAHWRSEILETLQICGALTWFLPDLRPELSRAFLGKAAEMREAMMVADPQLPFVEAFFTCYGATLAAPGHQVFAPEWVDSLLSRAPSSAQQGPALDQLCDWLRNEREVQREKRLLALQTRWSSGNERPRR